MCISPKDVKIILHVKSVKISSYQFEFHLQQLISLSDIQTASPLLLIIHRFAKFAIEFALSISDPRIVDKSNKRANKIEPRVKKREYL